MPARTASINAGASIMLEHVESASAISVGSRISSVERRTMTVPLTLATSEDVVYRNRFRQKRLKRFLSMVDEIVAASGTCNILDVGGNVAYWLGLEPLWRDRPCHITLVNIGGELVPDRRFTSIAGDARDLSRFRDLSFDLVHSNSVIEHVGLWRDQLRMAQEVRRLAPRYFVQTPNFWFPIEPHFRTPLIHWLPEPWRVAIVMHRACGFYPRARSCDQARHILDDARLLDARAMAELFPDGVIERERFAGLTKSLVAIR
jgi:hypothetical protein